MKIEAKDLRIGNLVCFGESGTIFTVGGISATGLDVSNEDEETWIEIDVFEPIPLTEELLLEFGCIVYEFDHKENQYRLDDRLFMIRDGVVCDYASNVKLPHVHTFQNFIFALTQKELKQK